ncbi:hypothetical protein Q5752_005991 [Cryptotrichosporon argae]
MRPMLSGLLRSTASPARRAARAHSAACLSRHRTYASLSPHTPPPTSPYEVFDELSKVRQRDRALRRLAEQGLDKTVVDYVRDEMAERLVERVEDIKVPPSSILELAAHAGQLTRVLQDVLGDELHPDAGKAINEQRWWGMLEPSDAIHRDEFEYPVTRIQASPSDFLNHPQVQDVRERVDAVVSAGGLHWVGDIVGTLTQIRHLLKPDGVFIGAVLGGDTLFELRTALQLAEQERRGGIANRVSPMISTTDAPSLLSRAGLGSTTVDVEDLTVNYPSMWELMADLRDMGESNAVLGRRANVGRDVLLAAEAIYRELYGAEDGTVPATFQIIFLIGWKPGPFAQQAAARGSGQANLKEVL